MQRVTSFFTEIMRRYLPDPFVLAIILTLLTAAMAFFVQHQSPVQIVGSWGKGFWALLAFTTQMVVMLSTGYVLATAPLTSRMLDKLVGQVNSPRGAIIIATLVGGLGSYLNWGFGLVIGSIVARKLALSVKGVHYPLIIASAYSGFAVYGLGLSSTIPVLISTKGHPLEAKMGVVPLTETIFDPVMLGTAVVLLATLPFLNAWLHPKDAAHIKEIDRSEADGPSAVNISADADAQASISSRLNNSRVLTWIIGAMGVGYVAIHFSSGGVFDINMINFVILFLGIIMLGTPIRYVERLTDGIKTVGGMILQYPFYAGILAIMASSGLVDTLSHSIVKAASRETLPFWGLISSYCINFFVPGAGGHWVIQGPVMVDAAKSLNASVAHTAMGVMLGNAWNDLVQPFWILPALAISKLKLKDVMGYTVISMTWVGIIFIAAMLVWR